MRIRSLTSLLAVGVLACGTGQATPQAIPSPPPAHAESRNMCPMMPAGTNIVASDTDDGISIAFTTTGDVADVRTRSHRMAEMHEKMTGMHHDMHPGMSGGMAGMGSGEPGMQMQLQMVPSHAIVEDMPGGARLVLVPADPTQLAELRAHVRAHVAMVQKGECPMSGREGAQAPGAEHAGHHPGG